ncbi:MAG: lipid A biosynthesis protein [Alphaproteobacteria bacterium]|nr:lipid A biosynthesis protein [Alphaproteobacteria bacterium]
MDAEDIWLAVGFMGQALFAMRFIVQWVNSERRRESVVPVVFWYFSLAGGATLLTYAIYRLDPVFITGQALGLLIYSRNLALIRGARRRNAGSVEPS